MHSKVAPYIMGKSEKRHPKNRTLFKYGSGCRTSSSDEVMKVMRSGKNVTMKQTQKMKKKKEKRNQATWIIDALPKKYKPKAYSLLGYITRKYWMEHTT